MGVVNKSENSLGEALRAWRDRLSPAEVGLPATRRRRTAGLRREELASVAGISVDYLLRLEQGRSRRPSLEVVASLARALRLNRNETCHLHLVAGLLPPTPGVVSRLVPDGVRRLVRRMGDVPVGVFSADWTLLMWTPSWAELLGDPGGRTPRQRNLARALFVDPPDPELPPVFPADGDDPEFAAALIADLRLACAAYPDDEGLSTLIREATAASARFRELWAAATLGSSMAGRRQFQHPLVGELTVDCDVVKIPGDDVRIVTLV